MVESTQDGDGLAGLGEVVCVISDSVPDRKHILWHALSQTASQVLLSSMFWVSPSMHQ